MKVSIAQLIALLRFAIKHDNKEDVSFYKLELLCRIESDEILKHKKEIESVIDDAEEYEAEKLISIIHPLSDT